jgi:hypothetical protein
MMGLWLGYDGDSFKRFVNTLNHSRQISCGANVYNDAFPQFLQPAGRLDVIKGNLLTGN